MGSEAEFFARQQHAVQRARHGDLVEAIATVTFESVDAFLAVLTPKRYELVKAVKQQGPFESIEALAAAVHRNRAAVSRDLKALAVAGLIRMRDSVFPGHGRRAAIRPVAHEIKIELSLFARARLGPLRRVSSVAASSAALGSSAKLY